MGDTWGRLGTHRRHEDILGYVGGQGGREGHMRDPGDMCVREGGRWGHSMAERVLCPWGRAVLEMMQLLKFLNNFTQGSLPRGKGTEVSFQETLFPGQGLMSLTSQWTGTCQRMLKKGVIFCI